MYIHIYNIYIYRLYGPWTLCSPSNKGAALG